MREGARIIYWDKYNNKEIEYVILSMFESFMSVRNVKTGKVRQIYRDFYGNIKSVVEGAA